MKSLQTRTDHLISVVNYAKLVSKSRERIYQLINENDKRIMVVKVDGKFFIDKDLSEKSLD